MNPGTSTSATEADADPLGVRFAHLQAVLEASSEGMLRLDGRGRAVTWNNAAARLVSPAVELVRGTPLADAFLEKSMVEQLVAGSLAGEAVTDQPLEIAGDDGRPVHVRLTLVPMQDGNRAIVGTTALLRDVGEETALQEALDREQHASLLKDEFLSTAAHELRSPLTSIAGFASLLARTAPNHAELIEPIERNARDMQRLVEALLDQARLESGRFSVQPTRFRLAPAVAELLTDDAEHLGDPHVETVIPADLTIDMDRQAFTLVLRNLVSNAVKYGDGGTITISGQASPGAVAVSVADDGPGIPEEHQAHLFEPFFRVPGELWSIRGSGLGLSIVQRYVERHGGEITCRSTLGEGSTFTFVVPTIDGL